MKRTTFPVRLGGSLAVVAMALTSLVAGSTVAGAQSNPYQRGPNPTSTSLLASSGPYSVSSSSVLFASGFGGGTIYYPTSTSEGTFGAVVIAPGFTASSSSYAALARRVASWGFVTMAMDTNTRLDFPDSRGRQILAALDYMTQSSSVRSRIDASRLAVAGHSMGGGGSLAAAESRPSLQAAVPLQPWHSDKTWSSVRVPTMIIGAENDSVAPVSSHAIPFYNSIPSSSEKAYVELNNASHFAATSNTAWQGRSMVVWLKRYVDNDTRFEPFMCPPPTSLELSDYRHTCPG